jgi:thiamine pyrophosphokinase
MSSHHFVKEGQEPALIIANGESCSYELLVSVMEWCPLVVVLDGAYERVKKLQIQPDIVIGDFDSLGSEPDNPTVTFIKIEEQETTDLEKALDYLITKNYTDINVLWASGLRLDHTINNFATLAKYKKYKIVLYDDNSKAFVLPAFYSKIYKAGDSVSLIPISKAEHIHTTNLVYELQNEILEFGKRSGISNQVKDDGEVTITYQSGTLAIIESIG